MDEERRRTEQERFVEEMGIYVEQKGQPRMAGRILGWLLTCDPPRQSASELAEALRASRGSISTMTQFLIRFDLIERIGVPGERQDYFRMKPGIGVRILEEDIRQVRSLGHILERGLRLVADQATESQECLREFHHLCRSMDREWPSLFDRWQRERETRMATAQQVSGRLPDPIDGNEGDGQAKADS